MTFLRSKRVDVERMLALLPPDLQATLDTMETIEITTLDGRKMVIVRDHEFAAYLEALIYLASLVDPGLQGAAGTC